MRFKLSPELCYMAGLTGKSGEPERSMIGIRTQDDGIEERFIKYAMALGVESRKIMIEEQDTTRHLYFYHSKLARMIREVIKEKTRLARKREMATAFLAGVFDAGGHFRGSNVTIGRLDKGDELLLELLGIHTASSKILNIKQFLAAIADRSVMVSARPPAARSSEA